MPERIRSGSIALKRKILPVNVTVNSAYPEKKFRNFRCLVQETIEWE